MRSTPSFPRRCALLIVVISPALLGSYFKCVAVSNPSVVTATIVQLEPTTLRIGEVMQATGKGSGTPPLDFFWDFGDGTSAAGSQAAHAYESAGSYRVTLAVRDALGNTAGDSSQVVVSVLRPTPVFQLSDAIAGQPVVFAVTLEADDGALAYTWRFSDGQSTTGSQAIAVFPAPGMYVAALTVTNDRGRVAAEQIGFEVAEAAPAY